MSVPARFLTPQLAFLCVVATFSSALKPETSCSSSKPFRLSVFARLDTVTARSLDIRGSAGVDGSSRCRMSSAVRSYGSLSWFSSALEAPLLATKGCFTRVFRDVGVFLALPGLDGVRVRSFALYVMQYMSVVRQLAPARPIRWRANWPSASKYSS